MSNQQYTPGPWSHGDYLQRTVIAAHKRIYMPGGIAAAVWSKGCTNDELEATASLIDAAPDLLEALEGLVALNMVIDPGARSDEMDNAIAAIAKAAGK